MNKYQQTARILFACGMIGLGLLGLSYRDFALQWQPVPAGFAGRGALAYFVALLMVSGGIGLLFRRTVAIATRVLFPYLALWLLLKIPAIAGAPLVESTWLGFGEIGLLAAGGWILFARLSGLPEAGTLGAFLGSKGVRAAQTLFAVSLLAIGLSHFVYLRETAELVPPWLPFRAGWAYLTGAGHIAAGLGVLFSIFPRLAGMLEAAMLTVFTVLVWVPAIIVHPDMRLNWTALVISGAISAGAWVLAASLARSTLATRDDWRTV